jgi:hypothetical protein
MSMKMGRLQGPFGGVAGRRWRSIERRAAACHRSPPEKEKAALGGLLLFDPEGDFFFTPYYQNTKSSTKTGQI